MGALTARGLAALKPGEWANDARPRGSGQLQARKLSGGDVAFYYRHTTTEGRQDRLPLGVGLTLAQAREQAAALSLRYQAGERDLRRSLQAEQATAAALAKAAAPASLGDLLGAYVESLQAGGKVSVGAVEKALALHVQAPWPELWASSACDVTLDGLLPVLSRLVQAGKRRQAGKIRSYLRAAYAAAIRARQDPSAPEALRELGISTNPARDLVTIDGGSNARTRALSLGELRAYWQRIAALDAAPGALLRFHLLTGGQRVAQLARVTVADLDDDTASMRVLDPKGRRKQPRVHMVPLLPAALEAIAVMRGDELGPFVFTVSHGIAPADSGTVGEALAPVVEAMLEAGELPGGRFTPSDVRRTVETRLAAAGQSDEARGHLQSHGLGGVQNRHYNQHRYDAEKRAALDALFALLTGEPAKVTDLAAAREARSA